MLGALREWDAPAYVIAEAGVNHGGDLGVAQEMVAAAAAAEVDAIKFQTYKAGRLATRASDAYWDRTKEPSASQYELFSRYDAFDEPDYRALADKAEACGIAFLSTPFDDAAVAWLDPLVPFWKVASADITNGPLLRRVGATGKDVALSTGASTLDEVGEAVAVLRDAGATEVALLHCTLSYPTATEDAAVASLIALRERFPDSVLGYSDHTLPVDSFNAIAAAYVLGARVIEKHFTLDESFPGNDHYHAFEPQQFASLVAELRRLRLLLGRPEKVVLPTEEESRLQARRSLVARGNIVAGAVVEAAMLDVKRPGTGIEPRHLDAVVGRRAVLDIPDDTTLQWEMLDGGAPSGR
jgi:sialic acid synthase SpsE